MTTTRGKRKALSSNKTEEDEAAENVIDETPTSASVTTNVEEHNVDTQLEDTVDTTVDEAMIGNSEGISGGEKTERVTKLDIDGQQKDGEVAEMDGDDNAESEENTFEDDKINDQEDVMWDDDEENADYDNEEKVVDEYDFSDEEATEEENEDDENSEEEAVEEDDDEAEVSEEENTPEEREIAKKGEIRAKAKEDGRKDDEHNTVKLDESLKIVKKPRERSRKKNAQADRSKKVGPVDKPESSRKKNSKKRVESMGMIFMCSSMTKQDCFQYRVFGLPEGKKADVEMIYTGMRLFLYDVDLKLMYGIYKAAAPGGYNIEPKAFKSQFPSQVRYKVLENCLPLAEEKFKKIIKGNYYTKTKFDCKLNAEQVKKLCKLFVASSKGRPSKKLGKSLNADKPPLRRERTRRKRAGGERQVQERPSKRPRKAISPARPHHRLLPPPLTSTLPSSYVYERASDVDAYRRSPYSERRDSYRDRRDPPPSRRPHGDRRDPPVERNDRYRDGRDPPVERNDRYRDGRDPPIERNDRYRDGRDPPIERNDRYRDERDSYLDRYYVYRDVPGPYVEPRDPYLTRRDPYRDGRDPYVEVLPDLYKDRGDPNIERRRDGRDPYLELRLPYRDVSRPELYSSYRRESLTDGSDVYRGDRGVEYRSSYRREEPLETRQRHDIASRDSYVITRERPSYAEPVYSAEYPSRTGLYRL